MFNPKKGLALTPLILALLLAACSGNDAPAATPSASNNDQDLSVTLGVVQSLSGAGGIYGRTVLQGIELAVQEVNASENGRLTMSIEVEDDRSDVAAGVQAFRRFADKDVTAIIGPTLSTVAFEALKEGQRAGVPVLAATTTALGITEVGDYIFRFALTEDIVVPATIDAVSEHSPVRSAVLILDSSDAFSRGSADAMQKGVDAVGGVVVAQIDVSTERDLAAALAGIDRSTVDTFLVTPLVDESAAIVTAIRSAGFDQKIIGGNSFNTLEIARKSGAAIEGAYVGAAWNPGISEPASQAFVSAYTRRFGSAPDQFAVQGYASVHLLADAVKRAGSTDHRAVRDALANTTAVETPLGSVSISLSRNAVHRAVVQQYRNGQLVVVDTP
jgi:branched-chain amino acid transport system substrate-binding protein